MPQPGQQPVYFRAFQFRVEIDQINNAYFQEISGIDATVDVIEYRAGGLPLGPIKLPGQVKHSNATFKRGYTSDTQLYDWFKNTMTGNVEKLRKHISIVQLDMAGQEVQRWNLFNAIPVKYTVNAFNAKGNDLSIETLEVAYEYIDRA
jgi:phage tail-like protein